MDSFLGTTFIEKVLKYADIMYGWSLRAITGGCNRKLILIRIKLEELEIRAHILRRRLDHVYIKNVFWITTLLAVYFEIIFYKVLSWKKNRENEKNFCEKQ